MGVGESVAACGDGAGAGAPRRGAARMRDGACSLTGAHGLAGGGAVSGARSASVVAGAGVGIELLASDGLQHGGVRAWDGARSRSDARGLADGGAGSGSRASVGAGFRESGSARYQAAARGRERCDALIRSRLSCVVQAGGSSTRMGFDKATATFRGRTLIEGVLEAIAPAGSELVVTTGRGDELAFLDGLRFDGMPVRVAPDLPGPAGAMRGVASSLAAATGPLVCIVACDMPFVSPDLVLGLARRVEAEELDVCVPRTSMGLEPLCAVWRRDACLAAAKELLAEGRERIRLLLEQVRAGYLGEDEIVALAGGLECFANINTPGDLAAAERRPLGAEPRFSGTGRASGSAPDADRVFGSAPDADRAPGPAPDADRA